MKWVKISERLPEKDTSVLVHIGSDWFQAFWDGCDFWKNGKVVCGITHWLKITGPEDCCEWAVDGEYNAHTNCGTIFGFRNTFIHCPNCGRVIKEVKP